MAVNLWRQCPYEFMNQKIRTPELAYELNAWLTWRFRGFNYFETLEVLINLYKNVFRLVTRFFDFA